MNWSQNYNCWKCFCHSSIALQRGRWRKGRRGGKLEVAGRRTRKEERRLLRPVTLLPPPEGCKPAKRSGTSASTTPGSSPTILPTIWPLLSRTVKRLSYKKNKGSSGSSRNQSDVRWQISTHSCSSHSTHTKFQANILLTSKYFSTSHSWHFFRANQLSLHKSSQDSDLSSKFPAQETRATLAAIRAPRRATAAWKKLRSGKWAHLFFSPKIQRNSINPHSFPWMKSLLQFAFSGTKVSKWTFIEVYSKLVGYFQKVQTPINSNFWMYSLRWWCCLSIWSYLLLEFLADEFSELELLLKWSIFSCGDFLVIILIGCSWTRSRA